MEHATAGSETVPPALLFNTYDSGITAAAPPAARSAENKVKLRRIERKLNGSLGIIFHVY
jgi:hypothetical protein